MLSHTKTKITFKITLFSILGSGTIFQKPSMHGWNSDMDGWVMANHQIRKVSQISCLFESTIACSLRQKVFSCFSHVHVGQQKHPNDTTLPPTMHVMAAGTCCDYQKVCGLPSVLVKFMQLTCGFYNYNATHFENSLLTGSFHQMSILWVV